MRPLFNDTNCIELCQNNRCKKIIGQECPDMFFFPNAPMAFGHVYLAYTKAYLINQIKPSNRPEFVCYNEQLCSGFDPNKTSIPFNNTICRRMNDVFPNLEGHIITKNFFCDYMHVIISMIPHCNTIPSINSPICDTSMMYQCLNSSKCIPQIRLRDQIRDCNHRDDEKSFFADHYDCPIKRSQFYFNCTISNRCVSRKLLSDGICDCRLPVRVLCEDEIYPATHPALHISFPHICNRILQFQLTYIDDKNETDESDCEQWPCHNIYTHCNGIFDCADGIDELDCHPPSLINCSSNSFVCFSQPMADYTCLSPNKINDGNIDCIGAVDETEPCQILTVSRYKYPFACRQSENNFNCYDIMMLCKGSPICPNDDIKRFCHHLENHGIFKDNGICDNEDASIRSDIEEFLCTDFAHYVHTKIIHFSLGKITTTKSSVIKRDIKLISASVSNNEIISLPLQHYCYTYPSLRVWLNKDEKNTTMTCLCSPGHYGDRCQYQNQRVSLTIQFRAFSDSWQTPFSIIVSLIDESDQRIIHSHEQFTYLPVPNCKTKYNIELLYATRPKNPSQQYYVHLDIYEKNQILSYRGSLRLSLPFPFLPVERVAVQLDIPYKDYGIHSCSNNSCGDHGRCVRYFNHSTDAWFCQCDERWSGRYCHIPQHCSCAPNSICIGKLTNNRSICVCPRDRWGSRCLLHDHVCRSNNPCKNSGQCIPIHSYVPSIEQFVCICRKGYSGRECEISPHTITLSFQADLVLPQSMLVHLIEAHRNAPPENGTIFKMIPIDRSPVVINIPRSFHIAFVEFIPREYYLIVVKDVNDRSKSIGTTLRASNHCPNITQIFGDAFLQHHLIRRIKSYHRPCQEYVPSLSCFYDKDFLCICTHFYGQQQANCFEFNHNLKRNCRGRSQCQQDAECLQDDANCPGSSICICPRCFYGSLCQFSSSGFGVSLDAILGNQIRPHVSIQHQPPIVLVSLTLTILIIVMGLLHGVLSLITFINKEPRKMGCGFYLIGSSITTLLISLIFCMKFFILLAAQMTYMSNKSFLLFQCRSLDFLLRTGLIMDQWLNACIAMERAVTVIRGIKFDKNKSKSIAKFLIPTLVIFTAATNIPEIIFRRLLEDESNDEKRIWCIVEYPSNVQYYNLVINIIHFCAPFIVNLSSAAIIIIITARLRTTVKDQPNHRTALYEKIQDHKNLLIAPVILILLAIPRLVIAFLPGCMKSYGDTWLFLMGYFISFIPPTVLFFIFVIPSHTYKEEFNKTIKRYRQSIRRTCFRLSQ